MRGSQENLYTAWLNGFHEMAEDARAEESVLHLIERYLANPAAVSTEEKTIMEQKIFDGIAYVWDRMTVTACCHNTVPFKKMQRLLRVRDCHKNTYLFDVENDNLKELMGEGA